jgi:hypothetical protein
MIILAPAVFVDYVYISNLLVLVSITGFCAEKANFINKDFCPCYLLHAGFFLGVFFDSEDGGDVFLRNVF